MELRLAEISDIPQVLALQRKYQIDTIKDVDKKDGFVTTAFTEKQLAVLVEDEQGLFLAIKDGVVIAYVVAASWNYWTDWPLFAFMKTQLSSAKYRDWILSEENSYQYGPICIDKSFRGSGILEKFFEFSLEKMAARYSVLITFINKTNERSFQAHTKKLSLMVLREFQFNDNDYYWLVCPTKEPA